MAALQGSNSPLVLVWGEDDFAVQRRARQIFTEWTEANPGGDAEILDGTVSNADEALRIVARLREALQTLPFFGGPRSVWLRSANFLGEDRVSEGQTVTAVTADLAKELGAMEWRDVRLLVSAGKIDRRRAFYRVVEKAGQVEHHAGLSADDRDWQEKAENLVARELRAHGKRIAADALACLVSQVGPHARLLASETEKVACYVGSRAEVRSEDVDAVVTRGRHARAFAMADAVGERNLPRALHHLDEELWAIRTDRQRSEIGLLYGLISKFRAMLLAKEMMREGLVRLGNDYRRFAAAVKEIPAGRFPRDRRYNPQEVNSYVLFRAAQHSANFSVEELVAAMEELLLCNRRLVGSGLEAGMLLQLAVTRIVGVTRRAARSARVQGAP